MKGPGVNEGTRPKESWSGSKGKADREKAGDAKHQQQQAERFFDKSSAVNKIIARGDKETTRDRKEARTRIRQSRTSRLLLIPSLRRGPKWQGKTETSEGRAWGAWRRGEEVQVGPSLNLTYHLFLVRSDVKQGKKNIIFGSGDGFSLVRLKQANTR